VYLLLIVMKKIKKKIIFQKKIFDVKTWGGGFLDPHGNEIDVNLMSKNG